MIKTGAQSRIRPKQILSLYFQLSLPGVPPRVGRRDQRMNSCNRRNSPWIPLLKREGLKPLLLVREGVGDEFSYKANALLSAERTL